METMDFSIAKKICVAYNICKGEDIMEPIQKRKNAVAFADAINSIEGVPLSPIARCLSDQWQQEGHAKAHVSHALLCVLGAE